MTPGYLAVSHFEDRGAADGAGLAISFGSLARADFAAPIVFGRRYPPSGLLVLGDSVEHAFGLFVSQAAAADEGSAVEFSVFALEGAAAFGA